MVLSANTLMVALFMMGLLPILNGYSLAVG
jgi:hypothetical protein